MHEFLLRRVDQPWAWFVAFGGPAVVAGAVAGGVGEVPGGWLGGAALLGGVCGCVGLVFGCLTWIVCRWIGGLEVPVRHPERWAHAVRCARCEWKTSPEGPVSRRDCLAPPRQCPACADEVIHLLPDCPRCEAPLMTGQGIARDMWRLVRWPRTWGQAFRGHYRCRTCDAEFDRWGRLVDSPQLTTKNQPPG